MVELVQGLAFLFLVCIVVLGVPALLLFIASAIAWQVKNLKEDSE